MPASMGIAIPSQCQHQIKEHKTGKQQQCHWGSTLASAVGKPALANASVKDWQQQQCHWGKVNANPSQCQRQ
eukprot:6490866-Amphidinium_carterae.1